MFQVWHTLIIALFIAVAYWMGYNHGVRKIEKAMGDGRKRILDAEVSVAKKLREHLDWEAHS